MAELYYYEQAGQPAGPVAANQLLAQGVSATTLVWQEGIPDWVPAATLPALAPLFSVLPPPLPTTAISANSPSVTPLSPVALPLAGSNRSAQPAQQLPQPLATRQGDIVPGYASAHPLPASGQPQFTSAKSSYKWWHILLWVGLILALLLLSRACGVILSQAISAIRQAPLTGDLMPIIVTVFN